VWTLNDIWRGVLSGSPACWRELVDRYEALVMTVARRTGLSRSDAQDCAQHVWMSLYRTRQSIKDPVALPAWLIRSTHRRAIRLAQKLARDGALNEDRVEAAARLPEDEVLALEWQAHLEAAMQKLDDRCRRMLTALFFSSEQKSYADIARELSIPPNSFGPTRSRCLAKLRKILEEMGYR
jgi:RNA polymerase sigma factor (sigma-70 family)